MSAMGQSKSKVKPNEGSLQLNSENANFKEEHGVVRCVTVENEALLQSQYSERASKEEFEAWLAPKVLKVKQKLAMSNGKTMVNDVVTIPVVVHVIHNGDPIGVSENISYNRVLSQITVLNQDYRRTFNTPGYNTNAVGADVEVEFCLAQTAPDGSLTDGIDRVNLSGYTWNNNNIETVLKPQTQWDPTQYFNIWVCQFGGDLGGVLGYAQFPDSSGLGGINTIGGAGNTDGVILDWRCFGSSDYVSESFFSGYDKGRTLTHEVGHCFGLRHIWGDSNSCYVNASDSFQDYCPDTPAATAANGSCVIPVDSCPLDPGNDMVENYMDYTGDTCMNTFTLDQKARILAVIANSPRRMELVNSTVCTAPTPENIDGRLNIEELQVADCSTDVLPIVQLTNMGNFTITTATISYYLDDNTPSTYTFTGSLAYGAATTISLPVITINDNAAHTFHATIASINNTADMVATNDADEASVMVDQAFDNGTVISLELQPDVYGSETSWELTNADGIILYSGENYPDGTITGNQWTGYTFTVPAMTTETWTLSQGCYTFTIHDSYGDGMCALAEQGYPEADGYYALKADGVEFVNGCSFENTQSLSFKINNTAGTESVVLNAISVYPNPAKDKLYISSGSNSLPDSYIVYNTLGQTLLTKQVESTADLEIYTANMAKGMYLLQVTSGNESKSFRFIKE